MVHSRKICQCCATITLIICSVEVLYLMKSLDAHSSEELNFVSKQVGSRSDKNHEAPQPSSDESHAVLQFKKQNINYLLYWGKRWRKDSWPPEGWVMDNCVVTYNRSRIHEAKAIVFHSTTLLRKDFPWQHDRLLNQPYIWWNSETPFSTFKELKFFQSPFHLYNKNFFNWTMTYKTNADVVWGYGTRGELIEKLPMGVIAVNHVIAQKTGLVFWVVSNCKGSAEARERMTYMKKLQKLGVSTTLRGSCFNNPLREVDRIQMSESHKFYFAFENSKHCTDYITEKFWDALKFSTVPIVWGPKKEDVLKVAPLNSFIFVEDYPTAEDLAKYLLFLDKNNNEYRNYFKWREDEDMSDERMIELVEQGYPGIKAQKEPQRLCEKVLNNELSKTIPSLLDIIMNDEPPECLKGSKP